MLVCDTWVCSLELQQWEAESGIVKQLESRKGFSKWVRRYIYKQKCAKINGDYLKERIEEGQALHRAGISKI